MDLTLGEHLHIWGERRRCMYKSGIYDTKPAISVKRSGLEPKLLQSIYRNLCLAYRLVTNLVNFGLLLQGAKFFHNGYLAHFLSERDEIGQRWRSGQSQLIPWISSVRGSRDTMNDLEWRNGTILRYFTECGSFRCAMRKSGWRCCRKNSSRSLSHLLMSTSLFCGNPHSTTQLLASLNCVTFARCFVSKKNIMFI